MSKELSFDDFAGQGKGKTASFEDFAGKPKGDEGDGMLMKGAKRVLEVGTEFAGAVKGSLKEDLKHPLYMTTPLKVVGGAAEALAAGAGALATSAIAGLTGLGALAATGDMEGFNKGKDAIEGMAEKIPLKPETEIGEKFLKVLGLIPEAISGLGEKVFKSTEKSLGREGAAATAAGTEALATLLTLKPSVATKTLGYAYSKVAKGPNAAAARDAFEDLAASSPEQARKVADHVEDQGLKQALHDKIDDITISKPKQVKKIFDDAKGAGKGAVNVTPKDVSEMFGEAKRNRPPSEMEVKETSMEEFEAAKKAQESVTPDQASAGLRNTMRKAEVEINGSGESAASLESINRTASEKSKGQSRYVVDSGTGQIRPLIGPEAVDQKPFARQVIIQRGVGKDEWTVLSHDPKLTKDQVNQAVAKVTKEDPVIYMNMGIPVTKAAVEQAFKSARGLAQKVPGYKTLEDEVSTSVEQLVRAVNPESLGPEAKSAAAVVAKNVAEQMQKDSSQFHRSEARRTFWNMRAQEAQKFIERFEKGEKFTDPTMQKAAEGYKAWNEEIAKKDAELGLKYEPRDNYLYHIFKDSEGVTRFFEKLYKGKWNDPKFIKDRSFELYEQARKAGFEPKYTNPEDIMLARQHASNVAEMRIQSLRDLETYGLARKATKDSNERLPGDVEWRSPNGQQYWVNERAAQILHNAFNTKSLWNAQGAVGSAFRGAMWMKNVVVPIKLALSLFHPLHVQTIDNATAMVRSSKELLAGTKDPGQWMKDMGKAAMYSNIFSGPKSGYRMLNVWRGKLGDKDLTAGDKQALTYMVEGGFIPEMAVEYKAGSIKQFKEALQKKSLTAAFHLPFAALEALQKPMFEIWIPSLKAASYLNDVKSAIKTDPSLLQDTLKRQEAFRKLAKSVDNRYGEMAYNTLFWNRWIKDLGVASTLSLGWNLGFLREYGGGAIDMGKAVASEGTVAQKAAKGDLDRPLFITYYTAQALAYGGLMTWAMTGQSPSGLMDYIYPKTGDKNPDGSDSRVNTMFYPREFAAIYKHMETEGVTSGLGHLVANKATPVLGMVNDWASNIDYFGKEISDPDAPAFKRLEQKLAHTFQDLAPIAISSLQRSGKEATGKDVALAFAGFTPAPKYATETGAEAKIKSLYTKYNKHVTPYERAQYGKEVQELRKSDQSGDEQGYQDKLDKIQEKYKLTGKQVKSLQKNLSLDGTVKMFKALTDDQQRKVLDIMTPEERDKYLPHAKKKLRYDYEAPQ